MCFQEFLSYFNTRLVANLRSNVVIGYPNWTNNNSESINHVLKSYTQWRVQQLPDLVEKLRLLVESQQIEADRSLCGRGDFELKPAYANHRLTIDIWKEMNDAQRSRSSSACFRLKSSVLSSTSTDGQMAIPVTPGRGKKPCQRKRPPNERTTSATASSRKSTRKDNQKNTKK